MVAVLRLEDGREFAAMGKPSEIITSLLQLLTELDKTCPSQQKATETADVAADGNEQPRRAAQTFHIPACNSWTRRKRLEKDVCNWLLYYGEDDPFVKEWGFTEQQREMAVALHDAISKGGDKAIGASRGDGKTTLCEWVTLFLVCTGKLKYAIYFASTEELSVAFISAMHQRLRENDRLLADYPRIVRSDPQH